MSGDPTDFQTEVDKFNEVMAMDNDAVEQLAQKALSLGTPTLTDEELAEMEARCDAAAPGPWTNRSSLGPSMRASSIG